MKQLYVLALLACWQTSSSIAQDLAGNATAFSSPARNNSAGLVPADRPLLKKSTQWPKEQDQVNGHINRTLLKQMGKTSRLIVDLLHDSCISGGAFTPAWNGEYFSEKLSQAPQMKFSVKCRFQPLASDSAVLNGDADNHATIRILANDLSFLFPDTMYVNGKTYPTIRQKGVVKKDCSYFEFPAIDGDMPEGPLDRNLPEKPHRLVKLWLVTAGKDKMPYMPVTRKEYLEDAIQEVKHEKEKIIAAVKVKVPVRPAEEQKADKEMSIAQIGQNYSGVEMQMRVRQFNESYKPDEDYQKEAIKKEVVDVDTTVYLMDSLLTHSSAEELKKPAIVSVPAVNFLAFEDSVADKNILVRINPTFFDPAVSGEKPQCFIVYWKYNASIPMAADIDRQFTDKFDFKKLQDLLGK